MRLPGALQLLSTAGSGDPEEGGARVQAYDVRSGHVTKTRRLFLISKNYLGIAAESVEVGDEVFMMPKSVTPFVTRKADDGSYKLMGEAYVHGITGREAASLIGEDALHWREIEIS